MRRSPVPVLVMLASPPLVLLVVAMLFIACSAFVPEIGLIRGLPSDAATDLDAVVRGMEMTDAVADVRGVQMPDVVVDMEGVEASGNSESSTDTSASVDSGALPEAGPRTWSVLVGANGANAFSPPALTINVGDTVHWVWQASGHTVTSGTGHAADGRFCSPTDTQCANAPISNAGDVYDHSFKAGGQFPYFCMQHDQMTGSITVR